MIPGSKKSNKKRLQRIIIESSSVLVFENRRCVWLHVWLQINTTLGGRVAGFGRQPCQLRRPLPLPVLGSIGRRVWRPVATAARGLGQGKTLRCLGESLYIQSWHLEVPRYSTMLGDRHPRWWMVVICIRNCIYFRILQVCTSFRGTDVFSLFPISWLFRTPTGRI